MSSHSFAMYYVAKVRTGSNEDILVLSEVTLESLRLFRCLRLKVAGCTPTSEPLSALLWRDLLEAGPDSWSIVFSARHVRKEYERLDRVDEHKGVQLLTEPEDSIFQPGDEQRHVISVKFVWWDWGTKGLKVRTFPSLQYGCHRCNAVQMLHKVCSHPETASYLRKDLITSQEGAEIL